MHSGAFVTLGLGLSPQPVAPPYLSPFGSVAEGLTRLLFQVQNGSFKSSVHLWHDLRRPVKRGCVWAVWVCPAAEAGSVRTSAGSRGRAAEPAQEQQKRLIHPVWALCGFKNGGGESSEMSRMQEAKRACCRAFVTDLKYTESVVLQKHASLFQKVTVVVTKSFEEQLWQVPAILGLLAWWHLLLFPKRG